MIIGNKALEEWILDRDPPIPGPFLPFLMEAIGESPQGGALAFSGLEALKRALRRPGRDRRAAFDLLSADALLTYACEQAAREPDIRGELDALLNRIGNAPR